VRSINVGLPRDVEWQGGIVTTGIFKSAVSGPVQVRPLNLEADGQGDLRVHGGVRKAVYAYPHEHYAYWREQMADFDFQLGVFGENLTTEGVLERDVAAGDRLEIGTAVFEVTLPRLPCYKLGIRFGNLDMVKRFWRSGRCGFYLSVAREGLIAAGDAIRLTRSSQDRPCIADVFASRGRDVA